jgi:apolipoprotein N-acyltransferase
MTGMGQSAGLLAGLAQRILRLRGWRRRGLAFILGLLAALALPPLYLFPLLVVGLSGLVWLIDGRRPTLSSFSAGWWWGFGHFIVAFYWIAESFLVDATRFAWMIPFAIGGLAAYMALYIGLAAALTRRLNLTGPAKVLAFAGFWVVGEWLRGHVMSGFPWDLAGYSLSFSDALNQYAALGGIWGLSLIVVIVAAMPATLAEGPRRFGLTCCAGALVLFAAVAAGGAVRLAGAADNMLPNVLLRLVQPAIPQNEKWVADKSEQNVALMRELTLRVPGWEHVSAAIWPETAVQFLLERDAKLRQYLGASVPAGSLLLTGAPRGEPLEGGLARIYNSLMVVDHDGDLLDSADKFHLVPLGEYVPLRRLFPFINKITPGSIDFTAGPGARTLKLPGLPPAGALICFEVVFPGQVVDSLHRPQWLLNITNDAWFGTSSGPYQHFVSARLRAVEEGLPLVRAANTGISGLVDPYGRVLDMIALGRSGVRDVPLPAALTELTPYARFGDWTTIIQLLLVATACVMLRSRRL